MFVVVGTNADYHRVIWNDVHSLNDAIYIDKQFDIKNKLLFILNKVHYNYKLNNLVDLPLKSIWNNRLNVEKVKNTNYIIFTDDSIIKYENRYLIKKKKDITLVLLLSNPMSITEYRVKNKLNLFDLIYTTDLKDAEKYSFKYIPGIYSRINVNNHHSTNSSDLFFVGSAKDRLDILHEIYKKLRKNANCDFYITNVKSRDQLFNNEIKYNKRLPYIEVLESIQKTNCILEILQKEQNGITLRTMEAIYYNKKLITNNEYIKNMPFYNEEYIRVINDAKEIDISFITQRKDVNYGIKHRYSPSAFFNRIKADTSS